MYTGFAKKGENEKQGKKRSETKGHSQITINRQQQQQQQTQGKGVIQAIQNVQKETTIITTKNILYWINNKKS